MKTAFITMMPADVARWQGRGFRRIGRGAGPQAGRAAPPHASRRGFGYGRAVGGTALVLLLGLSAAGCRMMQKPAPAQGAVPSKNETPPPPPTASTTPPRHWWQSKRAAPAPVEPASNSVVQATEPAAVKQTNTVGQARTTEIKNRVIRRGNFLKILVLVDTKAEIELNNERVSEEGEIFLPLLKQVRIADKNVNDVVKLLTQMYRKYYVNPDVYVELAPQVESGGGAAIPAGIGSVTVSGRVKSPGIVPLPPNSDLTISRAVLLAGGLNSSARDRSVRLTRHEPDGKITRRTVDLRAILEEGDLNSDVVLKSGDTIYVPESFW